MRLITIGFNFYVGYVFPLTIHDSLSVLDEADAQDFYKVIFVKSGTYHFNLNNKKYVLTGAHAICLNETDRIEFYETSEADYRVFIFPPSILNDSFTFETVNDKSDSLSLTESQDIFYIKQFLHKSKECMKIISLHTMDASVIEHKLQLLRELITKQDNNSWPCRSRSNLFEILLCLSRQEEEEPVAQAPVIEDYSQLTVNVIYYLQSCYNQKITIEMLEEEFHINRTSLLNDFKKHTGTSINQYLIQLRLKMASTLLRDTKLSVDEICERVGFNDLSYFSRMFKRELLYTPTEYRKNVR